MKRSILLAPAETHVSAPAAPPEAPAAPAAPPPAAALDSQPAPDSAPPPPSGASDDPFSKLDADFEPDKTKTSDKAPDKGKEPAKPADDPDEKVKDPKALRERLAGVKAELSTKNSTLEGLQKKLADLESKHKDTTALTAKIATLEKQIEEKEGELRRAEFKASPDYQKNYETRWNRMTSTAKKEIDTLRVGEWRDDPDTGEKKWVAVRPATWERDFAKLYAMDRLEARQEAQRMFGPEADAVMENYINLKRFQMEMSDELERERTEWQSSREKERAEKAQREEGFKGACAAVQKDYEGKFPGWYQPDPADKKTEELLKQGWDLVSMKPSTFQQAVILSTRNRMNAAAAPMLQYKLGKVEAELAEARATIEKLKGSKPGAGQKPSESDTEPDITDPEVWAQEATKALSK